MRLAVALLCLGLVGICSGGIINLRAVSSPAQDNGVTCEECSAISKKSGGRTANSYASTRSGISGYRSGGALQQAGSSLGSAIGSTGQAVNSLLGRIVGINGPRRENKRNRKAGMRVKYPQYYNKPQIKNTESPGIRILPLAETNNQQKGSITSNNGYKGKQSEEAANQNSANKQVEGSEGRSSPKEQNNVEKQIPKGTNDQSTSEAANGGTNKQKNSNKKVKSRQTIRILTHGFEGPSANSNDGYYAKKKNELSQSSSKSKEESRSESKMRQAGGRTDTANLSTSRLAAVDANQKAAISQDSEGMTEILLTQESVAQSKKSRKESSSSEVDAAADVGLIKTSIKTEASKKARQASSQSNSASEEYVMTKSGGSASSGTAGSYSGRHGE